MSKSTIGLRRSGLAALATTSLVMGAIFAGAGVANADADFDFTRIAGADRYETSADIAEAFGAADTAILASGEPGHYPDALSANFLAGVEDAPVLLTMENETPQDVLDRLEASGVDNVIIVGGELAVSAAQEQALKDAGYTVTRESGQTRFDTNAEIIAAGANNESSDTALIATGLAFPDALAGGPAAYKQGMPIGLSNDADMPDNVIAALKAANVNKAIILGGTLRVPASVETELEANGIDVVTRLAGQSRSATAVAIAEYGVDNWGFTNAGVNVASGRAFGDGADALAGGPLTGKQTRPLLITENETTAGAASTYLTDNARTLTDGIIFGGNLAITPALESSLETAARSVTSNQDYSVTPNTPTTLNVVAGDTPNDASDDRQYSVSGLDATKNYVVALVDAANVKTDANGQVTFVDTAAPANQADGVGNTGVAHISVVNGTPQNADSVPVTGASTINFTVEGDTTGAVVPVVFQDANGNGQLELVAPATANTDPKAPAEDFGVGGRTTYVASEAPLGSSSPVVDTANTADDYFMSTAASTGGTARTYNWDGNDVFQYQGVGITQAEFESMISAGDALAVSYNPNAAGASTFNVQTDAAPTQVAAPTVTVTNADGGTTRNDVRVTYTRPAGNAEGTTYTLQRRADGAGADTTCGTGDDVVGTFANVAGATQAPGTATNQYVFSDNNVGDGCYVYRVNATNPVSGTTTPGAASTTVTVPEPNDTTGPQSTYAANTTVSGLAGTLDNGDVLKFVFNEPMAAPAAGNTIRLRDTDATASVGDLVNGTNATFSLNTTAETVNSVSRPAGTVLTVTLTGAPTTVTAGTVPGIQRPATVIDSVGVRDASANRWDLSAGDVVID